MRIPKSLIIILFIMNKCGMSLNRAGGLSYCFGSKCSSMSIRNNIVALSAVRLKSSESIATSEPESKWPKRKVALVVGYVGTRYYGLQMDANSTLPTIESELERSLYKIGCISDLNHRQLSKIGWSRSSRTDKGVHCGRLVITTKLLLNPEWLHSSQENKLYNAEKNQNIINEYDFNKFLKLVNDELPYDIRVFSCSKVNNGFHAKEACNWREYEYILPADILMTEAASKFDYYEYKPWSTLPKSATEAVQRLNEVLRHLEGSHSFHNFHKGSGRSIRKKAPAGWTESISSLTLARNQGAELDRDRDQEEGDHEEDTEEEEGGETIEDKEHTPTEESLTVPSTPLPPHKFMSKTGQVRSILHFDPWERLPRESFGIARSNIYCLHASLVDPLSRAVGQAQTIRIKVCGQSFQLNQIRLIVGAAVAVVRGIMPKSALSLALLAPIYVPVPLAPAEGLVLVNAGFVSHANDEIVYLRPPELSVEDNSLRVDAADPDAPSLLDRDTWRTSEEFLGSMIYDRIAGDWRSVPKEPGDTGNTERPSEIGVSDKSIAQRFLEYCERFRVSEDVENDFQKELLKWTEWRNEELAINRAKDVKRISEQIDRLQKNEAILEDFHRLPSGKIPDINRQDFPSSATGSDDGFAVHGVAGSNPQKGKVIKKPKISPIPHKKLLPNGSATALLTRFHEVPGERPSRVLRALASAIVRGEIPREISAIELVDLVATTGGLQEWSKKEMHPLVY